MKNKLEYEDIMKNKTQRSFYRYFCWSYSGIRVTISESILSSKWSTLLFGGKNLIGWTRNRYLICLILVIN